MPTHFSGQLYQFDNVPVGSAFPFLTPYRRDTSGTTLQEYGKIYYVGKGGDDNNDGLSWDARKATIASAITLSNGDIDDAWGVSPWGPSNVIVIGPGSYAENLTSMPHGAVIYGMGLGGFGGESEVGVEIKPASGSPIAATWVNGGMYNITLNTPDTSAPFAGVTLNHLYLYNVRFSGLAGASITTTDGLSVSTGSSNCVLDHCQFVDVIDGIHCSGDWVGNLVVDCTIDASGSSSCGIRMTNNKLASYSHVRRTSIGGGTGTLAIGVDGQNTSLALEQCWITATDPCANTVVTNECYGNGGLLSGAGA